MKRREFEPLPPLTAEQKREKVATLQKQITAIQKIGEILGYDENFISSLHLETLLRYARQEIQKHLEKLESLGSVGRAFIPRHVKAMEERIKDLTECIKVADPILGQQIPVGDLIEEMQKEIETLA